MHAKINDAVAPLPCACAPLPEPSHGPLDMEFARQIMEICSDNIFVKDADGRFLKASPACMHHFGKTDLSELIGKTDFDLFDEEHARQAYRDEQHVMATGEILEIEEKETWPDGSVTWARTTKKPLRNAEGEIMGIFGVSRDITRDKLAEGALKKSEERFRLLFNNISDSIFVYGLSAEGLQGNYVEVNDVACKRFGYTREELLGKSSRDLDAPELRDSSVEELKSLGTEQHHRWTGAHIAKNGQRIEVEALTTAFELDGNKMFLSAVRDVSERREMEKALAQNERLLDELMRASVDMIYFKDRQHRFIRINNKMADCFGISSPAEAVGTSDSDYYPEDLARQFHEDDELIMATGEPMIDQEQRKLFGKGEVLWASTTKIPLRDENGNIVGLFGISRNITERRKSQETLQKTLAELERSNQELEQFAYVASHDLQEPLRLVSAYSQLLIRRYRDKLDEEADPLVNFITQGINRMQQLIQDLLAYSHVSSQHKPFTLLSCELILDNALGNLAVTLFDNQVKITRDPLPFVHGDQTQLSQLFQNLIGNAIKFKGVVAPCLHIGAQKSEDGSEWIFSVKDNGIGIDPEYFDRIFVIFQRLHSRSKYTGTGIGLSICKRVVEVHGGRIWVQSEKHKGTTFFFSIPAPAESTL